MNQISTTALSCNTAQLSLIDILTISEERKRCNTSKCSTVLLARVEHGDISIGDVLRIKNASGQTITEKVCRIEIDKTPHKKVSVPIDFKKPHKSKEVGILLENTTFLSLQKFLK
jgi:hypothetical protein